MDRRLTAYEVFLLLALAWERLNRPYTVAQIQDTADLFIEQHGELDIDTDNLSLLSIFYVIREFHYRDEKYFRDLLCKVGSYMELDFMQFIGHYFYASFLNDAVRDYFNLT